MLLLGEEFVLQPLLLSEERVNSLGCEGQSDVPGERLPELGGVGRVTDGGMEGREVVH